MSGLKHAAFMLNLVPLHHYSSEEVRTTMKISTKLGCSLLAAKRRHRTLIKMSAAGFGRGELAKNYVEESHAANEPTDKDDSEQKEMQDEAQNFRNARGGSEGGGNNGNGNGNGSGGCGGGGGDNEDDYLESNQDNTTGIEWWWWWWWKWQQARLGSHLWPVGAALQVVANELKETIEPAVRAIVVEPLREHAKHVLILVLVVGAFVVACMEMVAGLAVVSIGVSLGFLATLGSAFLWWSWKRPATSPSPPHNGNGNANGNGKGETAS